MIPPLFHQYRNLQLCFRRKSAAFALILSFTSLPIAGEEVALPKPNLTSPKLNSERIEETFGSYGIEVLRDIPYRVSMLYSTHEGERICRTLAIVSFAETMPDILHAPISKVKKGASLGATLKESGFQVEKRPLSIGILPSGPRFLELAKLEESQNLAFSTYELSARKDHTRTLIATIIEVYHPAYLDLKRLQDLMPSTPVQNGDVRVTQIEQLAILEMKKTLHR